MTYRQFFEVRIIELENQIKKYDQIRSTSSWRYVEWLEGILKINQKLLARFKDE